MPKSSRTAEALSVEWWPLSKPVPYEANPRVISEAAVEKVALSIGEYGWRQPIVVDEAGVVVAGHTRLLAAQKLGRETVPVHVALAEYAGHLCAACQAGLGEYQRPQLDGLCVNRPSWRRWRG